MPEQLSILDFDVECLPGHWIGSDYVSRIITAVAWALDDEPPSVMTHYDFTPTEMSLVLARKIEEADLVTGHFIRGFDLPLVNGMLLRAEAPSMGKVLSSDTKLDLKKASGRSLSQKNLADQLGVEAPKVDRTLREWESFNLREPGGREAGEERVAGDVIQHQQMRKRLIELGWLGGPKLWSPESKRTTYHA